MRTAKIPECHGPCKLVRGKDVYPHRPALAEKPYWLCSCGNFVGCHPRTQQPLGTPADGPTRQARLRAHQALDPLWRGGTRSRSEVYAAASRATGIYPFHIGNLDREGCARVIEACANQEI